MPTTAPIYGEFASQSGGDVLWTDPTNMDGAPDTNVATATINGLAPATATTSNIFGDNLAVAVPPGSTITSFTVLVRAADSGNAVVPALGYVQLVDGTPIGVEKSFTCTAVGLTDYTLSGSWGVTWTRSLIENLRLAFRMTTAVPTIVGVDSIWLIVTYQPFGGVSRSRTRLARSR